MGRDGAVEKEASLGGWEMDSDIHNGKGKTYHHYELELAKRTP